MFLSELLVSSNGSREDAQGNNFVIIFIVFHCELNIKVQISSGCNNKVSDKFMSKGIAVPHTPSTITNIFGPLLTRGPL